MKYLRSIFSLAAVSFIGGLTVGTLFAPHKGSVNRRLIKNKFEDAKDMAEERMEESRAKLK